MKPSRFTDEQIIGILKEQESGMRTADVCRKHGISEATFYKYKAKFGVDSNIGSVYGYGLMDQLIFAFDRAGKDLTTDKMVAALESIQGFRDIFGGPPVSYGPNKHQGADEAFLFQVQKGRFMMVAGPVSHSM